MDASTERIYGLRELTRILNLTPRRLGQLRRLDLLKDAAGYTFRDLLAARAASALLDAGASVRQIRQALTALRRQDPTLEQPLSEVRFFVERNPGYQRGHELVCLCEVETHNMKPLTLKLFEKHV